MIIRSLGLALAMLLTVGAAPAANLTGPMIRFDLDGAEIEGAPLAWSTEEVTVLARDGRLVVFHPGRASEFRQSAPRFQSYSDTEMRGRLLGELGRRFEVTTTGHYIVAHPAGERDAWSQRFETLYRAFVHYFSVRGFRLESPPLPLVAVVWKNQADFARHAASEGARIGPNVLGYYSSKTNRVHLYDSSGGGANAGDWETNAATIIHEATHQTAFNTGVHSRFGETPRWVVEGLGTLFEASGVYDSRGHGDRSDRVNRPLLEDFRALARAGRWENTLHELVAGDRAFEVDARGAYARAWGITFYLIETQPRRYAEYVTLTARRKDFQEYAGNQRLADFTRVFGGNFRLLEAHALTFLQGLE